MVLLAVIGVACSRAPAPTPTAVDGPAPSGPTPSAGFTRTNARVTRIVDGDTIEVRFRGSLLTIRLIGIDTPETFGADGSPQCYAAQATAFTTEHLSGQRVRLEFDVERIDPFGRTLAYVWLGDELFNEILVREGYAFVTTFPPNVRYVDRFLAAQREARAEGRGVWGACVSLDTCDPAYPDVCIPPPPPDLECADVDERRFAIRPPDPHNFDGDGNGIGCEAP
jgi:micrococcal nuclease